VLLTSPEISKESGKRFFTLFPGEINMGILDGLPGFGGGGGGDDDKESDPSPDPPENDGGNGGGDSPDPIDVHPDPPEPPEDDGGSGGSSPDPIDVHPNPPEDDGGSEGGGGSSDPHEYIEENLDERAEGGGAGESSDPLENIEENLDERAEAREDFEDDGGGGDSGGGGRPSLDPVDLHPDDFPEPDDDSGGGRPRLDPVDLHPDDFPEPGEGREQGLNPEDVHPDTTSNTNRNDARPGNRRTQPSRRDTGQSRDAEGPANDRPGSLEAALMVRDRPASGSGLSPAEVHPDYPTTAVEGGREEGSRPLSEEVAKEQMIGLLDENPRLTAASGNLNEPGDSPTQEDPWTREEFREKSFEELTEDVFAGKPADEQAREQYRELRQDYDFSSGEMNTILGEARSRNIQQAFQRIIGEDTQVYSSGVAAKGEDLAESAGQFAGKGAAFYANLIPEMFEVVPDRKPVFDTPADKQLYGSFSRSMTTAEQSDTISADYSPETVTVDDDPFSLQDARTVSKEQQDEFSEMFAGLAASPVSLVAGQTQRRAGQAQQLASGEMTPEEAIAGTTRSARKAGESIRAEPYQAGFSTLIGAATGSALASKTNIGNAGSKVTEKQASAAKLQEKSGGEAAVGEGFSKAETEVQRTMHERLLGMGKTKEYETSVSYGVQASDSGTSYVAGNAVTRDSSGDVVNEESFVASGMRESPEDLENRVGEMSEQSTKIETESGAEFLSSRSTLAGKVEGEGFTKYLIQGSEEGSSKASPTKLTINTESSNQGSGGKPGRNGFESRGGGDEGLVAGQEVEKAEVDAQPAMPDEALKTIAGDSTPDQTSPLSDEDIVGAFGGAAVHEEDIEPVEASQMQGTQQEEGIFAETSGEEPGGVQTQVLDDDTVPATEQRGTETRGELTDDGSGLLLKDGSGSDLDAAGPFANLDPAEPDTDSSPAALPLQRQEQEQATDPFTGPGQGLEEDQVQPPKEEEEPVLVPGQANDMEAEAEAETVLEQAFGFGKPATPDRGFERRRTGLPGLGLTESKADNPEQNESRRLGDQDTGFTPTLSSAIFGTSIEVDEAEADQLESQVFTGFGSRPVLEEENGEEDVDVSEYF